MQLVTPTSQTPAKPLSERLLDVARSQVPHRAYPRQSFPLPSACSCGFCRKRREVEIERQQEADAARSWD